MQNLSGSKLRRNKGVWPTAAAASLISLLALGACDPGPVEGQLGFVEDFAGLIASDSAQAAVAGRDVLTQGGTAADAAVTMAFVMSVTLPSRASLGSGGTCLYFNRETRETDAIIFPPAAKRANAVVPAMPRAMAALHAQGGTIRWEILLSKAENLARFGHPVSRALAQDLVLAVQRGVQVNQSFAEVFTRNGRVVPEGFKIEQPDLAATLGGLRGQGISYLIGGAGAQRLIEGAEEIGLSITKEDLRSVVPGLVPPVAVPVGDDFLYLPPLPSISGIMGGQIAFMLEDKGYVDLGPGDRAHLMAEVTLRAVADRQNWLQPGGSAAGSIDNIASQSRADGLIANYQPASRTPAASLAPAINRIALDQFGASFVVGDRYGNAAACSFSMNTLLGSGQVVPGTGILMAQPPRREAQGAYALPVALVANTNTGKMIFAGAASGGPAAAANLGKMLAGGYLDFEPLAPLIAEPRLVHVGNPDGVAHEASLTAEQRAGLTSRGHTIGESTGFGTVNVIACEDSLRNNEDRCQVENDPRGYGLKVIAQ